jgi:hypothetical protein
MASELELFPLDVISFIVDSADGRTTNHDLVRAFRRLLNHPEYGADNKIMLKEVTRKVGTIKSEEGNKYIVLQARFRETRAEDIALAIETGAVDVEEKPVMMRDMTFRRKGIYKPSKRDSFITPKQQQPPPPAAINDQSEDELSPPPPPLPPKSDAAQQLLPLRKEVSVPVLPPKHGQAPALPPKELSVIPPPLLPRQSTPHKLEADWPPPPPPEAVDDIEDKGSSLPPPLPPRNEVKFQELEEEEEEDFKALTDEEKRRRFAERRNQGKSVKDLAQDYNDIANSSQLQLTDHNQLRQPKQQQQNNQLGIPSSRRRLSTSVASADTFLHLTKTQKEWILAASKNNMYNLKRLLDTEKGIAGTRDPWNGYTALHWAAKHGNQQLVQLLVAEVGMNPNVRSRGGYTPLILAATCNRNFVYQYLVNSCGANPDIRDFSGRKAGQYLDDFRRAEEGEDGEDEYGLDEDYERALGGSQTLPNLKKKAVERSASFLRELAAVRGSMRTMRHHKHFKSSLDTVDEA